MILNKRIEEASFNAWPALHQILYDGWILRFSKGYTKRANSVTPLWDSQLAAANKVNYCEKLFEKKNLRKVFRLTPFAIPSDLDKRLADRSYTKIDPTAVLTYDLQDFGLTPPNPALLRDRDLDTWLADFCLLSGYDLAEHKIHREILSLIPTKCFFAALHHNGDIVSCALGVLEADHFGLFDLVTAEKYNNQPAWHLYQKLGFRESYSYWYRVKD